MADDPAPGGGDPADSTREPTPDDQPVKPVTGNAAEESQDGSRRPAGFVASEVFRIRGGPPESWKLRTLLISAVIVVACLIAAYIWETAPLGWKPNFQDKLAASLGALLLVSALVERVVEVFLAIWKRSEVDQLEQRLEFEQAVQIDRRADIDRLEAKMLGTPAPASEEMTALKTLRGRKLDELTAAEDRAELIESKLVPYFAETRRLAMWIGMAVGVLASFVGVRLLAGLVESPAANTGQYTWFIILDVLFTGAVLAGGSKGVHHLSNLLASIVEAGNARAAKQKLDHATPPTPPADGVR